MYDEEQVSRLIGDIYDAALDAALWRGTLERLCGFVGGSGGGLYVRDTAHRTGHILYQVGTDPRYVQLYFEKYIKFDPLSTAHLVLKVGEVVSSSMIVPPAEFFETPFYKEWVQPQGWIDNILVTLERSGTTHAEHVVFRHEQDGIADEAARKRMRLVAPHLRRAVLIGNMIDLKTSEAAALADTLDGISAGMFLLDARGRIVHANASGRTLLAEASVLSAARGKLATNNAKTEQALHEAFLAAGGGDAAVGTKGIAVELMTRDGERYLAHVLPLTSGARRKVGIDYAVVAALFVHKAALAMPSPPEIIARTFKLTPSELRVLLGIVEVGGVPETAAALGIGEATVRTHLLRLYAKTNTRRQAELVKLVAGFSSPLIA
jgi:DNA-binding CsgD family transcriptional regulator